jgi:hypothetical protein
LQVGTKEWQGFFFKAVGCGGVLDPFLSSQRRNKWIDGSLRSYWSNKRRRRRRYEKTR